MSRRGTHRPYPHRLHKLGPPVNDFDRQVDFRFRNYPNLAFALPAVINIAAITSSTGSPAARGLWAVVMTAALAAICMLTKQSRGRFGDVYTSLVIAPPIISTVAHGLPDVALLLGILTAGYVGYALVLDCIYIAAEFKGKPGRPPRGWYGL